MGDSISEGVVETYTKGKCVPALTALQPWESTWKPTK